MTSKINLKLNQTAALLIGFGVPSLVAIYYIIKRKRNYDPSENNDQFIRINSTIIEVRIPNECVKHVIGPQGSVIKEVCFLYKNEEMNSFKCGHSKIQRKTNTRINFKEKPGDSGQATGAALSGESLLLVRGSPANAQRAELEIKRLVLDMPVNFTKEFLVPEYACGRIIGRGGNSIKEISVLSNCKVNLDKKKPSGASNRNDLTVLGASTGLSLNQTKLLVLTGSMEQIEAAKELIITRIKEEDALRERKKPSQNRSSRLESTILKANDRKTQSYEAISRACEIDKSPSPLKPNASYSSSLSSPIKPALIDIRQFLNEDKRTEVCVSAISGMLGFWVQINSNCGEYQTLTEEISDVYNSINSSFYDFFNKDELKNGDLVAVKSSSQEWHRGEVRSLEVKIDGVARPELIDIYYIDQGVSDYVKLKDMKRLATRFYETPMQAIECALDDIAAVRDDWSADDDDWSDEAIQFFENFVFGSNCRLLEYISSTEKRVYARLFDKDTQESISDLMIQKGLARPKIQLNQTEPLVNFE